MISVHDLYLSDFTSEIIWSIILTWLLKLSILSNHAKHLKELAPFIIRTTPFYKYLPPSQTQSQRPGHLHQPQYICIIFDILYNSRCTLVEVFISLIKSGLGLWIYQAWGQLIYQSGGFCYSRQCRDVHKRQSWRLHTGKVLAMFS